MPRPKRQFNPEGRGYDYAGARAAGLSPNKSGHWPSRDPRSGKILKGWNHPTIGKTKAGEARLGNSIRKVGKRYYSSKSK